MIVSLIALLTISPRFIKFEVLLKVLSSLAGPDFLNSPDDGVLHAVSSTQTLAAHRRVSHRLGNV